MNNEPFKNDPNRFFRKGDKVHVKREVNGRPVYIGDDAWEPLDPNEIWSVEEDELETGWVHIKTSCVHATVWHAMLELVTPAEEAEPFYITRDDEDGCYLVQKDDGETTAVDTLAQAFYFKTEDYNAHYYTEEQAKKLANEACNRLNAEYRKENNHA